MVRVQHIASKPDAFKEHKCELGKVYVEVEPNLEYFIRLTSSADEPVYADIAVDGQKIETGLKVPPDTDVKSEKWEKLSSDHGVEKAFIFESCKKAKNVNGSQASLLWTGEVKIDFFGNLKFKMNSEPVLNNNSNKECAKDSITEATSSKKLNTKAFSGELFSTTTEFSRKKSLRDFHFKKILFANSNSIFQHFSSTKKYTYPIWS